MNVEDIRVYCLNKKGVIECFPFDEDTLVFKVMGKMFLLVSISDPTCSINVKCDPDRAIQLREQYEDVQPGYHMNKKMWNSVTYTGAFSKQQFYEMIDHSYDEVVKGLIRKDRLALNDL
ncbi:MAG: MmcQ/YjbR family DNA-binding protein [Chitinophagales bacterium]